MRSGACSDSGRCSSVGLPVIRRLRVCGAVMRRLCVCGAEDKVARGVDVGSEQARVGAEDRDRGARHTSVCVVVRVGLVHVLIWPVFPSRYRQIWPTQCVSGR